jgi:NHLM bacteriocin system ABC transporter peptidase/ATP-binding protein/NHLM bacteriocin system ABC transporter ATP-binding protein
MESTECGAASLGIILAYYGYHVPLAELRTECRVSRDGTNALFIKKTAEKFGLTGRGYQMTIAGLRALEPPYMVFWELNHFLVVEGFGRDRVYLNDPATGRRTVSSTEFEASYTGIVFRFEPGPSFRRGGAKPDLWKSIGRRMASARTALAFIVLGGAFLMLLDLVGAAFGLVFIDQLLVEGRRYWIRPLLLGMAAFVACRTLADLIERDVLRRLKQNLALVHSARFLWHVLHLPVLFYQQRYAGDVSARVESNSTVAEIISGELGTTAVGLLMLVVYAAIMFALDPVLAALGVAVGAINLVAIVAVNRFLADENLKIKQARGKLYGHLMRTIQIIETIKSSAAEPEALVHLTGHQARITNAAQVVGAAWNLLVLLPPFLSLTTTALVLGIGGHRVIDGMMSVGALVAFQTLLANFQQPISNLVRLGSAVQSLQAELSRLDDVHHYEIDPIYTPSAPVDAPAARRPPARLSGHLTFRDVTFGFNRTLAEPLIQRFSLELRPGSRVALVGDSGSGKSTIGRLAAGLYRPWDGEILYDGFRLDEIPRDLFTQCVAFVDDQAFLFRGTVRENLALWDETIANSEIHRAAIDAAIHRDLLARREGYNARLAEGARNLSGGQRQRLEICRALVRNPALLILDEATSALDPVTEALVDDNLRRRGCTCLIIAHRLSTIRDCDEIIVLRQGRVIQRGTHEQLMADSDGFYHELQSLQERSLPARAELHRKPEIAARRKVARPAAASLPSERDPDDAPPAQGAAAPSRALALSGPVATVSSVIVGLSEPDRADRDLRTAFAVEEIATAANLPLELVDAGAVWRVVEGKVDLFHVPHDEACGYGERRHLCRIDEGGSIFAIDGASGEGHGVLMAVGVGPARLRKSARAELMRCSFHPAMRRDVAAMIDDWVERISRAVISGQEPGTTLRLEAGGAHAIEAGGTVTARSQVLWLRSVDVPVQFAGMRTTLACPVGSRFPLAPSAWLQFEGAGIVQAVDSEMLMEDGDPWAGLQRFHSIVLEVIAESRSRETALADSQRERCIRRDQALFARAVDALSGRTEQRVTLGPPGEDDPLLLACRAVGQAQGIDIKSPLAGSQDSLRSIARASGARTRRVRLALDWWKSDLGPLLGFLAAGNHPVALLRTTKGTYRLVDPVQGTSTPVNRDVAQTLSPVAVMFYRSLLGTRLSARDLWRISLPAIRSELWTIVIGGGVSGLLGLVIPWVTAVALDDALPRADHRQLAVLCVFLVAVGLAMTAFRAMQSFALVRIKGRLESELLAAAWDRLLNLPTRFFANKESGNLALRAMGLAHVIEFIASSWIASLLVSAFSLANLVVLFFVDARLAWVAAGLMAVIPLTTLAIARPLWRRERQLLRVQGEIAGFLLLLVGGVSRLRVAGAERRGFTRWAERYKRQLDLMTRARRLGDALNLFVGFWPIVISMAVFATVVGLGPDTLTTGAFIGFNVALAQTIAAVCGFNQSVLPAVRAFEEYQRFRPILKAAPESSEHAREPVNLQGGIRVNNVSFRYEPDGPLILDSVDLQVRPGEFVAIVGASGSGKSSLLRLLLGFENPTTGVITYDGVDLPALDLAEVRRQLGVVLQDGQLRAGDIVMNIVGHAPHLARDDAWAAARLVGLDEEIEQMPMGIHTVLSEGGGGVSSGQRQRLLIARALAARPKVLLLDEATSALDNRSQSRVLENIRTQLPGTTVVTIAHRLSTVVDADRIYVMSGGQIVQSGRYAELLREPGPFRELAKRQAISG